MPPFFFFWFNMTTAWPCHADGTFLHEPPVCPTLGKNDQPVHDWTPFKDHLAFDWAYYHYVTLEPLAAEISEGLDLWSAMSFKHGSSTGAPWKTVRDMYVMIDAVQAGSLPFKTHHFYYKGLKLLMPSWMEEPYDLDAHDTLAIVWLQLATLTFKDQFDYVPYQEFNSKGEQIWSNLMSAQSAFKQAVCPLGVVFWITFLTSLSRMSSHEINVTMGLCLYPLLLEVTRQLFWSWWVIKNITLSTFL